jgi:hypothetical protein
MQIADGNVIQELFASDLMENKLFNVELYDTIMFINHVYSFI